MISHFFILFFVSSDTSKSAFFIQVSTSLTMARPQYYKTFFVLTNSENKIRKLLVIRTRQHIKSSILLKRSENMTWTNTSLFYPTASAKKKRFIQLYQVVEDQLFWRREHGWQHLQLCKLKTDFVALQKILNRSECKKTIFYLEKRCFQFIQRRVGLSG